ncbi:MAG: J domain-containing protein [Candidatus Limnocylindrales bacterium]
MEYKDYYAALGVPRTASQAEIKKAFRKLAREHHPDVNKGAAAERRFKEVNEANAVLGDPQKRKAYDALGADWEAYQRADAASGGPAGDPFAAFRQGRGGVRYEFRTASGEEAAGFSDFFRAFFSGATAGAQAATRGGRRTTTTTMGGMDFGDILGGLGLDEAGATSAPGSRPRTARLPRQDAAADVEIVLEEAYAGTARRIEVGGKRLEVSIPRGVADGQKIRLSGKAGSGPDAGHVYLHIRLRPHPVFTRKGDDLHRELPITLEEALLGAEVPVETLKGKVLLRIPPETQSGRVFRLSGRGMPRFKADGYGDLYVRVRVVLPSGLESADRDRLRAFTAGIAQPDPRTAGRGRDPGRPPIATDQTTGASRP